MKTLDEKIEWVRGLDAARTQGEWELTPDEEGSFECPCCGGEGYVEGKLRQNWGKLPDSVVFYGIGEQVKANQKFTEAAPAMVDIISELVARLAVAETELLKMSRLNLGVSPESLDACDLSKPFGKGE